MRITGQHQSPQSLQHAQHGMQKSLERLAKGKRIARAADDAAGLAIAQRLHAQVRGLDQGARNVQDTVSLSRTAEGGLDATGQNLQRMRELSVQARNGTLSDADRQVIQQEYDQLAAEVTRTSEATTHAGQKVIDGSLQQDGVQVHDGQQQDRVLRLRDHSAAALGVEGRSVGDPQTLQALDHAIDRVSQSRAEIGAAENALQHREHVVRTTAENQEAARSRIEDADFAHETAELTRHRILSDSAIALAAHGKRLQSASLKLLG
jgi:flagellin